MRSFTHGLVLAGLPVLVFLGIDYLVAPPASVGTANSPLTTSMREGVARMAQSSDMAASPGAPMPTASTQPVATHRRAADSVASPQASLTAAIQQELRRVGCYAGDADGSWSGRTQAAMQAFNSSVHVNLDTTRPDYILLTLLQGHSAKACSRACEADLARAGTCADKSLEARAVVPATGPTAVVAARVAGEARLSSSVAPAPVASQKPQPAVVEVTPSQAAVGSATTTRSWDVRIAAPAPAVSPVSDAAPTHSPALPGRMAVGATQGVADQAAVNPGALAPVAPPVQAARPRPAAPRSTSGPSGPSRLSRTFSELSRNSP